jgi:hypothetical protein
MDLVFALSNAVKWDIALIGVFVVLFGGLVNGIVIYALIQSWGERKQNEQDRLGTSGA